MNLFGRKLEKLERRTARAIGEVIRERLRAEEVRSKISFIPLSTCFTFPSVHFLNFSPQGGEEDLASAVAAGASYSAQTEEED